jgi:hypothetical protein
LYGKSPDMASGAKAPDARLSPNLLAIADDVIK